MYAPSAAFAYSVASLVCRKCERKKVYKNLEKMLYAIPNPAEHSLTMKHLFRRSHKKAAHTCFISNLVMLSFLLARHDIPRQIHSEGRFVHLDSLSTPVLLQRSSPCSPVQYTRVVNPYCTLLRREQILTILLYFSSLLAPLILHSISLLDIASGALAPECALAAARSDSTGGAGSNAGNAGNAGDASETKRARFTARQETRYVPIHLQLDSSAQYARVDQSDWPPWSDSPAVRCTTFLFLLTTGFSSFFSCFSSHSCAVTTSGGTMTTENGTMATEDGIRKICTFFHLAVLKCSMYRAFAPRPHRFFPTSPFLPFSLFLLNDLGLQKSGKTLWRVRSTCTATAAACFTRYSPLS